MNVIWYHNTRIIIVSDHGANLNLFPQLVLDDYDVEKINALLMFKDFDSHVFSVSDSFMTNADVPTIAFNGIIDNPVNPFTCKYISSEPKFSEKMIVTTATHWDTQTYNGTTFDTSDGV